MVKPDIEINNNDEGWSKWAKFVLRELERLNTQHETLNEKYAETTERLTAKIYELNATIDMLKTEFHLKAGVWGAAAGVIPALLTLVYFLLTRKQ